MKKEVKENEEHHLVLPDDVTVMEAARLLSPLWATLAVDVVVSGLEEARLLSTL